jgi:hypothetical protein
VLPETAALPTTAALPATAVLPVTAVAVVTAALPTVPVVPGTATLATAFFFSGFLAIRPFCPIGETMNPGPAHRWMPL